MANYYTHFSSAIQNLTAEERAWCVKRYGELIESIREEEEDAERIAIRDSLLEAGYELEALPGFDAKDEKDRFWIHTEESGSPTQVAIFLSEFLKKFRPKDAMGFQYADTCSRPLLDSYGGGAMFVTADGFESMHSSDWLCKQENKHKAAKEAD